MKRMYGITTAMLTPVNENGEVLVKELEDYVEFLIEKGVHCLYPVGSIGEMNLLRLEQRKLAAKTVIDKVNGRIPVFVHIGAVRTEDTMELARHAYAAGADGIGAVTPSYWPFKRHEVIAFYKELSKQVPEDFPIYMYNIPQYSTIDVTTEMAEEITSCCKNITGIKYSVGNMARTQEYLKIKTNDFSVIQGGDLLTTLALSLGCDGVISGYSSVFPEYFVNIYNCYKAGRFDEANALQREITDLTSFMKKEISTIPKLKAYLSLRGIQGGVCQRPFQMPSPEQEAELKNNLRKYKVIL